MHGSQLHVHPKASLEAKKIVAVSSTTGWTECRSTHTDCKIYSWTVDTIVQFIQCAGLGFSILVHALAYCTAGCTAISSFSATSSGKSTLRKSSRASRMTSASSDSRISFA